MKKTWRIQIINFPTECVFSQFNYSKTWAQELSRSGELNQRKELSEHVMAFMVQNTELRLPSGRSPETANTLKCTSPRQATGWLSLFPWMIKPRHSQPPHVPQNHFKTLSFECLTLTEQGSSIHDKILTCMDMPIWNKSIHLLLGLVVHLWI